MVYPLHPETLQQENKQMASNKLEIVSHYISNSTANHPYSVISGQLPNEIQQVGTRK